MSKKAALALQVVSQPAENWYKDEGGKSNVLHCVVRSPIHVPDVLHLRCSLFYESETIVEDKQSEILSIANPRGLVLGPDVGEIEIEFRIEKVSRRKDGQRFKLYIEPDAGEVARMRCPLVGVFTTPINVMSKRKTGERVVSRKPLSRPVVDLPDESTATLKMLHATLLQMQRTLDDVSKATKKIDRRVASIEAALVAAGALPAGPPAILPLSSSVSAIGGMSSSHDGSTSSSVGAALGSAGHTTRTRGAAASDAAAASRADALSADSTRESAGSRSRASKEKAAAKNKDDATASTSAGNASGAQAAASSPALQFAVDIFGGGPTPAAGAAGTTEMPPHAPALIPGLSHQISALAPDFLGHLLPPSAALHGVKRIRSTDIAVDYTIPADAFSYATAPSAAAAGVTAALEAAPASLPLRAQGSLSRLLSRQTSEDVGAWFDHFLHSADPPEKFFGDAAGTVKRAKLQVVETVSGTGEVNVGLYTDDPLLAATSANANASTVTAASAEPPVAGEKRREPEK